MSGTRTCTVAELRERLERGDVRVLDVRDYPEYAEAHLDGSRLEPLGRLRERPELAGDGEVFLLCRSGRRATEAAAALDGRGGVTPVVVGGGIEAWRAAGYPLQRGKGPISLERQVRIAAGALVLTGVLLDAIVPGFRWLAAFVGAGLMFAGITDTCAMGRALARLPWNQSPATVDCPRLVEKG